jgi:hypothetical protein
MKPSIHGFGSAVFALVACVAAAFAGCDYGLFVEPCGEIAEGGCPVERGGTCDEEICAALYECIDGAWELAKECPGGEPTGSGSGGSGAGGAGGAGPCTPVIIDHEGEISGCVPDLQEPDCPAVAAEGCAESVCSTGCLDFFLCTEEGWTEVAYCDDDGNMTVLQ